MVMYLVRKTLSWTLVVFLATNLTFFLASSFLDPRSNYQGRRPPLTPEQITDRDCYIDADTAIKYGLANEIITSNKGE